MIEWTTEEMSERLQQTLDNLIKEQGVPAEHHDLASRAFAEGVLATMKFFRSDLCTEIGCKNRRADMNGLRRCGAHHP